ncbi:hypothetical protein JMUB7507_26620 [Staphylococcus aureus]
MQNKKKNIGVKNVIKNPNYNFANLIKNNISANTQRYVKGE